MASKEELVDAVKREISTWSQGSYEYAYNTGYGGRYVTSTETVTDSDFWAAVSEIKSHVVNNCSGYTVRGAKSFSGELHNEWSVLVEPYSGSRKLNFHIRVSG